MSSVPAQGFTIGTNFTGTDLAAEVVTSGGLASYPPDTMGAVGPNHIAELINGAFAVYNKTGVLQNRTTMDNFWQTAFNQAGTVTAVNGSFDPRLLYDTNNLRWYAAAVDSRSSATSRVLIGVTTGNNPALANWRGFTIDTDTANTRWGDFPTLGMDSNGIYVSLNMLDNPGGAALAMDVTVIGVPKASLTAGVPSIAGFARQEIVGAVNTGFDMHSVVDLDNTALPLEALSAFNAANLKRTFIPANFFAGGGIAPEAAGDFIA